MAKAPLVELLEYGTARILAALVGRLPWRCATGAGKLCGAFLYYLLPAAAYRVRRRIGAALRCSRREERRIARGSFAHSAAVLFELMKMRRLSRDQLLARVEFDNLAVMEKALAAGRGVIAVTGHIGNWEMLGAGFAATGYPLAVVVRLLDNRRLDRWLEEVRQKWGALVVPRDSVATGVRFMRQGRVLAFLMDQNAACHGVFVPFFGKDAATVQGPAYLSRRFAVPAVLCWARRLPGGKHRLSFAQLPEGGPGETVRDRVALYNRALEQVIREAPEQWLWLHPRWRTQPPGSGEDQDG